MMRFLKYMVVSVLICQSNTDTNNGKSQGE